MLRSHSARSLSLASVAEEDHELDRPPASSNSSATRTPTTHARQHSRIHERNLSAFFPRPGQLATGYGGTYDDPHATSPFRPGVTQLEQGSPATPSTPPAPSRLDATSPTASLAGSASRAQGRRGHHHRHSVSHNLFPFLDANGTAGSPSASTTTPLPNGSPSKPSPLSPTASFSRPRQPSAASSSHDQLPSESSSFREKYGHLPFAFRVVLFSIVRLSPRSQLALVLASVQLVLGSTLWVQGQAGESLSVTGLGYLVVFDGLGALSGVALSSQGIEKWKSEMGRARDERIRKPYGSSRLPTLSHFSQSIYLLFSAVYVCKESIEHVLLLHGPDEGEGAHGSGHGGVGHGEARGGIAVASGAGHGGSPVHFPLAVLVASSVLAILSALVFSTHLDLSRSISSSSSASSPSSSSSTSHSSPLKARDLARNDDGRSSGLRRVLNPFTVTVAGFGVGLACAALVLPSAQLSPLDKILSLLISLSMFYVAYPAAVSTGSILLQTAPGPGTKEGRGVRQAFNDIESHPSIVSIASSHVWQLSSPPSHPTIGPLSSSASLSTSSSPGLAPLELPPPRTIMTLHLVVRSDLDERGVVEVVEWAEERCRNAGLGGMGKGQREVTIEVKRAN
ncbi:hypothetical protein JCM10212_006004 [Sporobolomyces blumeae]